MRRRRRPCRGGAVLLLALAGGGGAGGAPDTGPQAVGPLEGIWKMCYEPGLADVVEVDSGYLVLMPGGRYYEVGRSCCDVPAAWELGEYEVEDGTVVLHSRRYDGTPMDIALRHVAKARAVFFDDVRGEPVEVEALAAGESIDCGWCRAYPGPEGR